MGLATPLGIGKAAVTEGLFAGTRAGLAGEMTVLAGSPRQGRPRCGDVAAGRRPAMTG